MACWPCTGVCLEDKGEIISALGKRGFVILSSLLMSKSIFLSYKTAVSSFSSGVTDPNSIPRQWKDNSSLLAGLDTTEELIK